MSVVVEDTDTVWWSTRLFSLAGHWRGSRRRFDQQTDDDSAARWLGTLRTQRLGKAAGFVVANISGMSPYVSLIFQWCHWCGVTRTWCVSLSVCLLWHSFCSLLSVRFTCKYYRLIGHVRSWLVWVYKSLHVMLNLYGLWHSADAGLLSVLYVTSAGVVSWIVLWSFQSSIQPVV